MSARQNEFLWPIRVYYEDTDSGGVVYYANYLKFMERARTEFLRSLGFEQDQLKQEQGLIFAVHSLSAKYIKPAVFNDELIVTTYISNLGRASLSFVQNIHRPSGETRICEANIKIACLDADSFLPATLPSQIVSCLNREVNGGS